MLVDCPQHAQPVAQVEDLRGACSVAFVKTALARSLGLPEGVEGMIVLEGERGTLRIVGESGVGAEVALTPPLRAPSAIAADDEALLVVEGAPPRIRIVHGGATTYIGDAVLREPVAVAAQPTPGGPTAAVGVAAHIAHSAVGRRGPGACRRRRCRWWFC